MLVTGNIETSVPPPAGQRVPCGVSELSAEWLTTCLHHARAIPESARVVELRSTRIGEGHGFAGQIARVELRYAGDDAGCPRTLIAKFATEHAPTRELMSSFDAYAREVRFYREVAPSIGLSTPRCYLAHYDREASAFLLLLEDLAPARAPDVETGLSLAEAELVLEQLAAMHARYWNRVGDLDWLQLSDGLLAAFRDRYLRSLPAFCARFSGVYPELVRVARRMGVLLAGDEFMGALRTPPLTLAHNDMHMNNLFLPTQAGGRFALIDWQSVAVSRHGITDVARILSLGLTPELRREHGDALLRHYHARLRALGVRGYRFRTLKYRFRQEMAAMVMVGVLALETLDLGPHGARTAQVFVSKVEAAVADARVHRILGFLVVWVSLRRFVRRALGGLLGASAQAPRRP